MSVLIIGAGLAGLSLGIKLKMLKPTIAVAILTNNRSGNTIIAGQRFRPHVGSDSLHERSELLQLLARRNGSIETPQMNYFVDEAIKELSFWTELRPKDFGLSSDRLYWEDRPEWFGPQWGRGNTKGNGRGKDVVHWLMDLATDLGVDFIQGTAIKLVRKSDHIDFVHAICENSVLRLDADAYVLAGGSIGGSLYNSTNVKIQFSPQELLYKAGFTLQGGNVNMFHIFGNSSRNGSTKAGCFETDRLSDASIYLRNKETLEFDVCDNETNILLKEHQAHYHFDDIAKRFLNHGGLVEVRYTDRCEYGKVSHHYSHLAAKTVDGTQVEGAKNLLAIGDAAGTGYWSGYQVRYPGFALTNCLVTASKATPYLLKLDKNINIVKLFINETVVKISDVSPFDKTMRDLNTDFVLKVNYNLDNVEAASQNVIERLAALQKLDPSQGCLIDISIDIARTFATQPSNGEIKNTKH